MIPEHIQKRARRLYGRHLSFYGPYKRKQDGRKVVILYDGEKRSAKSLAKFKIELHLRRLLNDGEEVDHKDDDKTNDKIGNLQVLTGIANRQKAIRAKHGLKPLVCCANCGDELDRPKSALKSFNFCDASCKQRFYRANQYGNAITGYH